MSGDHPPSTGWPGGLTVTPTSEGLVVRYPVRHRMQVALTLLTPLCLASWFATVTGLVWTLRLGAEALRRLAADAWFHSLSLALCVCLTYVVLRWFLNHETLTVTRRGLSWAMEGLPWRRTRHLAAAAIAAIDVQTEEITEEDSIEVLRREYRVVVQSRAGAQARVADEFEDRETAERLASAIRGALGHWTSGT